jgi:peptide/nickel transport system substrate-binding protein
LRDKRVRLALNYAVNKQAIADGLYGGLAKPTGQLGAPGNLFWDDSVQPIPFDPARAKQMLAEAGYPSGFSLPVGLGFSSALHPADIAAAIQADLRNVGVEVAVSNHQLTVYSDKMYARSGNQKEDLFLTSLGDPSGTFSAYRGFYDCGKTGFEVWWCSPEFNRLFDLALQEPDAAKRAALMRDSNRALREDIPAVWLVIREATNAVSPKIKGFEWDTPLQFNFDAVYRVD